MRYNLSGGLYLGRDGMTSGTLRERYGLRVFQQQVVKLMNGEMDVMLAALAELIRVTMSFGMI